MTRIAHIMTPHPTTIPATATAEEAARAMLAGGLRHLPVVDAAGVLVGILSDRDLRGPLLGDLAGRPAPARTVPVASIMTTGAITAVPDDDVGTVARQIVEHRIGAVPIVDAAGTPVGIVSFVDVLRRLAEEAEQDARAVALID
ncbi:MAG: CBS domain-containing protein [Deltaproteobacteria bacterium]|nr:CBS domain-containing protein [Deltaproteobacteria bacterium]